MSPEYLPSEIRERYNVFDGDKLFMEKQAELFPYITKSPKESKKLAQEFVVNTFDSLVENALSSLKRFKEAGYEIHLKVIF